MAFRHIKVAVIDQDPNFARLLAENLRSIGFSQISLSYHPMVAQLRVEQGRDDLYVIEAHDRFREFYHFLQAYPDPPILILSYLGHLEPYAIGKTLDWDGFLPKLFTKTYLREVMSDVLLGPRARQRKLVVMPSSIPGRRKTVRGRL